MNVKYFIALVILICLPVVAINAKGVGVTSDCKTEGESCSSSTIDLRQILDQTDECLCGCERINSILFCGTSNSLCKN